MCSDTNHELFIDYENRTLILKCNKCRCKWRVKCQFHVCMLSMILGLSGTLVIIGLLTKQRWLIPAGIILSSWCSLLDYFAFLVLKHFRLNWSRIKGEQFAFDHND